MNQCPDTGNLFINLAPKDSRSSCKNEAPTESEKIYGHYGFYSRVEFDKDGKFISQGFWE